MFRAATLETTEEECRKLGCFRATFPTGKQQQPKQKNKKHTKQNKTKPHQ